MDTDLHLENREGRMVVDIHSRVHMWWNWNPPKVAHNLLKKALSDKAMRPDPDLENPIFRHLLLWIQILETLLKTHGRKYYLTQ